MSHSGHRPALQERRLNHGLQTLPSGRSAFPIPRNCEYHRSINQKLPELWSDFSDRGLGEARRGHDRKVNSFYDGLGETIPGGQRSMSTTRSSPMLQPTGRAQCIFVGFCEIDMDGRYHTAGEMDRIMGQSACAKYPCSRPATLYEYEEGLILGLPSNNTSGRDIVFTGPGATGCELYHTNTLGAQKCMVPPGDALDGSTGAYSLCGRKCCICIYPFERVKRQQSLTQFGLARKAVGDAGGLRKARSLASLQDKTKWTEGAFSGSSHEAQRSIRMDQFFR